MLVVPRGVWPIQGIQAAGTSASPPFWVNRSQQIPYNGGGLADLAVEFPVRALYDTSGPVPSPGQIWGPKPGSFKLWPAYPGFQILDVDAASGTVLVLAGRGGHALFWTPMQSDLTATQYVTGFTATDSYNPETWNTPDITTNGTAITLGSAGIYRVLASLTVIPTQGGSDTNVDTVMWLLVCQNGGVDGVNQQHYGYSHWHGSFTPAPISVTGGSGTVQLPITEGLSGQVTHLAIVQAAAGDTLNLQACLPSTISPASYDAWMEIERIA